jgi:hypothetical protein
MKISEETRNESYLKILDKPVDIRNKQVLKCLNQLKEATANEISLLMYYSGYTEDFNRNYAQPRLNWLVDKGIAEVTGKRKCNINPDRTCITYKIKRDK